MRLKSFHRAGLLAALFFIFTAAQSRAELPPDAQAAVKKGIIAAKEQEWEIAIQSFQDARKIAPNAPEIYYNLGLAESKMPGRELRAIAWFGAYLAATTNAPNADAVKDAIAGLQIKSEGNIRRLIKTVQDAAGQLPDVPIRHDGGIQGNLTNKADEDRMNGLFDVACLLAAVGNSDEAIQLGNRVIEAEEWNKTYALSRIVDAQANAGRIADAIKTASSFYDVVYSEMAQLHIATAQIKTGDIASAKATLATAASTTAGLQGTDSVYLKNSQLGEISEAQAKMGDIPSAQRTAGLIPSPERMSLVETEIADAQVAVGDTAGAQASLLAAQQSADRWISMTDSQKVAACNCTLDPHDNLLTDLEMRIGQGQIRAGDFPEAKATLLIARRNIAANPNGISYSQNAYQIVDAQVKAGDILEAQETAKLITDSTYQGYAATDIAIAQAKAGDIAGATKTAALGNPISKWQVDSAIADAKRRAAEIAPTNASVSQSSAVQPNSVPPHQIAPPSLPAITLADWIGEIDNYLNKPLYSDLADAVKNPQQAFKTIYSGGWDFDHGGDAMKDFLGLKAIASVVVDEKNKIDQMLKQQAKQQAQQNTVKALDDDFEVKKSGDTPHIPPPPPPPPSH